MLTRLHISSFVGLTVAAWLLVLWMMGTPLLSFRFLAPFGIVVTTLTVIVLFFTRVAWAWPVFKGWYVNRPDLRGTWRVEIRSNWINPATQQLIPPITAYAAVRETLTMLSIRLMTPESRSKLVAYSIEREEDGVFRLAGLYRNEPNISLQGVKSEIHHGALWLEVIGDPPTLLRGHYWTDRNTRGEITFSNRRKGKLLDTYEAASAAMRS